MHDIDSLFVDLLESEERILEELVSLYDEAIEIEDELGRLADCLVAEMIHS